MTSLVRLIEINHDSLCVHIDWNFDRGTCGFLKFSLGHGANNQSLITRGFFENLCAEGRIFKINKKNISNRMRFIKFLNEKQINKPHFMKKAAGL